MFTGCMTDKVTTKFYDDGTGYIEMAMTIKNSAIETSKISIDEIVESLGGTKDTYTKDKVKYTKISYKVEFNNVDEFNKALNIEVGKAKLSDIVDIRAEKEIKNGREIVNIYIHNKTNSEIIDRNVFGVDYSAISKDDLSRLVELSFSFEFPDAIDGVSGLNKKEYKIAGKRITFTINSGDGGKKIIIKGSLGKVDYNRFPPVKKYENNFKDVPDGAWYIEQLAKSYSIGLINGTSDTTFAPNDYLTLAQVVTMAARVRSIYEGDNEEFTQQKQSDIWYKPYITYAVKNGILKSATEFKDYDRSATRAEMVHIFSKSLPAEVFMAINPPRVFDDVPTTHKYYSDIMAMYSAGVIMGTTETTFAPNSNITRAQAAVIIARVANIGDKVPR